MSDFRPCYGSGTVFPVPVKGGVVASERHLCLNSSVLSYYSYNVSSLTCVTHVTYKG